MITIVVLSIFSTTPALAANKDSGSKPLGNFGNWRTYSLTEHNQPVCYMTLTARFPKNAKVHRGDAYLTITHRPSETSKDVISYTAGYNYKPMSAAELHIGKQNFSLFTSQDTAWSRDAATDHKITAAIRTTPTLTISGSPVRKGIATLTDKFALKGADQAYRAISKACGVGIAEPVVMKPAKAPVKSTTKPVAKVKKK